MHWALRALCWRVVDFLDSHDSLSACQSLPCLWEECLNHLGWWGRDIQPCFRTWRVPWEPCLSSLPGASLVRTVASTSRDRQADRSL